MRTSLTEAQERCLRFVIEAGAAWLRGDSLVDSWLSQPPSGAKRHKNCGLSVAHLLCKGMLKPLLDSQGVEPTEKALRYFQP